MEKEVKVLAVDLDGTLINSDMLHETFWSAFSNDILIPLKAFIALCSSKTHLKKILYDTSSVDIKSLPYNDIVIEYINLHRSKGWKIVLITGTNQELANEISNYLNLFDEVYGSNLNRNLIGLNKANFQNQVLGFKNYDYIGNSFNDICCWQNSEKAITLNAGKALRRKCEIKNNNFLHLESKSKLNVLSTFIKEMRPYQWIKNTLVFLPIVASQELGINYLINSLVAFLAFSFVASSVYFLNDLLDLKNDRYHPKKRNRPFASGDLPLSFGVLGAIGLLLIGSCLGLLLGSSFVQVIFSYFTLTLAYSLYLKQKSLVDIFVLSGLYTIRIIGGGIATNLEISFWLLAFSIFIFLSLAAIKRQTELRDLVKRDKIEIQGRGYEINDLDFLSSISISSGLISSLVLALYINSPKVLNLYSHPEFLWCACALFLYWNIRICFKTHRGQMDYDPIIFAFKDKFSRVIFITIFLLVILASFL
tara:strand:+ start:2091 stop:3524 length:1434 start_codon:yes stop_codon:yes gene_type:complete